MEAGIWDITPSCDSFSVLAVVGYHCRGHYSAYAVSLLILVTRKAIQIVHNTDKIFAVILTERIYLMHCGENMIKQAEVFCGLFYRVPSFFQAYDNLV